MLKTTFDPKCIGPQSSWDYDLEPFVIEPNKILLKRLRLSEGKHDIDLMTETLDRKHYPLTVCISFILITPDEFIEEVAKPVEQYMRDPDGQLRREENDSSVRDPVVLLHSVRCPLRIICP